MPLGGSITQRAHLGRPIVVNPFVPPPPPVVTTLRAIRARERPRRRNERFLRPPVVVHAFVPVAFYGPGTILVRRYTPRTVASLGQPRVIFGTTYISFGPSRILAAGPVRWVRGGDGSAATSNVSTPVQTNTVTDPYVGWLRARRRS